MSILEQVKCPKCSKPAWKHCDSSPTCDLVRCEKCKGYGNKKRWIPYQKS